MRVRVKTHTQLSKRYAYSENPPLNWLRALEEALPKDRIINIEPYVDDHFYSWAGWSDTNPHILFVRWDFDILEKKFSFDDLTPIMSDEDLDYELHMLNCELDKAASLVFQARVDVFYDCLEA